MKNTASTFIQYLENKKTPGHKKVVGFTIESGITKIQFKTFPSISEWLAICEVWSDVFEQNISQLHIEKL